MTESKEEKWARRHRQDKDFIHTPGDWPHHPVLPVKELHTSPHLPRGGVLLFGEGPKVFLVNLFDITHDEITNKFKGKPFTQYSSYDELLLTWTVD